MFLHQNRLEYVLKPQDYSSEARYCLELDRLFRPAWHLAGTASELPNDGDFLTFDLLGEPVLLRNCDGEYHAFQNVCTHRHCLLTHEERGHSPKLRCQYHGWEFDPSGRTGRIPDARCFRPFDRENARLRKFRLESCGDLLFVSLSDHGPCLRDFLSPHFDLFEERFSTPLWRPNFRWSYEIASNWKVPIDNTLESYHIPCLHPKTFSVYPSEEASEHILDDRYSVLRYDTGEDPTIRKRQGWVTRQLGATETNIYAHYIIHPNIVFVLTDLFCFSAEYLPTSPTTTRVSLRSSHYRGSRRGPLPAFLSWLAGRIGRWMTARVMNEDLGIFADQQRGLEVSQHPGCLGTREERVFVFQDFVRRQCDGLEGDQRAIGEGSAQVRQPRLDSPAASSSGDA